MTTSTERPHEKKENGSLGSPPSSHGLFAEMSCHEDCLVAFIKQMPSGVLVVEATNSQIVLANAPICSLLGPPNLGKEKLLEYTNNKLFRTDGRSYRPHEWALARSLANGELVQEEEIMVKPGENILLVSSYPLRGQDGNVVGAVALFNPRSNGKQKLRDAEQNEKRLRKISESGMINIVEFDSTGMLTGANDAFLKNLGFSREEFDRGEVACKRLTPPEWVERTAAALNELKATKVFKPFERQYFCKDGRRVWMLVGGAFLEDGEHAVAYLLDTTSAHKATAALRKAEERYRLILESATNFAIFTIDLNGLITTWNRGAETVLGYQAEEILGRSYRVFYPSDQQHRPREVIQKAREEGRADDECWLIKKDSSAIWVNCSLMALRDDQNRVDGYLKIIHDATRQKQATDDLSVANAKIRQHTQELEHLIAERTQSLQKSLSSMETLCYTIAHDLRAPLRAMQSFATLLIKEFNPPPSGPTANYANEIRKAAHQMDDLLRYILAYGELSHRRWSCKSVNLDPIVELTLKRLERDVREAGGQIRVNHPLGSVRGNASLLGQVMTNLIHNALKFTAPGVAPQVVISTQESEGIVKIMVRDNGIGIDPLYHRKIFGLFERLHSQQEYPGTGIGLAIVQKAVETMGGDIQVSSVPGEGSTFTILLDRAAP